MLLRPQDKPPMSPVSLPKGSPATTPGKYTRYTNTKTSVESHNDSLVQEGGALRAPDGLAIREREPHLQCQGEPQAVFTQVLKETS